MTKTKEIRLGCQVLIPKPDEDKLRRTNILFGHQFCMGGVVRATCRGLDPRGREAHIFRAKNHVTSYGACVILSLEIRFVLTAAPNCQVSDQ